MNFVNHILQEVSGITVSLYMYLHFFCLLQKP